MNDLKKRILFTLPNFKTSGSKYVLLALYKGLNRENFQPFIVVEKFEENIPDSIPKEERLLIPRTISNKKYILAFKRLLKENNIDLVHSWDYRSSSLEAIASRLVGVKYIYTKKNNAWSKRWFAKSLLSSHIVYNNPEMLHRFFTHILLKNKVSFIPHGVPIDVFKPIEFKKETNDFVIGFIGVIGPNKNQLFLLKALSKLPKTFKVQFYGQADTAYLELLKQYILESNLSSRVTFNGFIENEDIPKVMQQFDVLVLASKNEGLPLCILEAMACGVPVLSSDSGGGARHLLQHGGGLIFDLENPEQLSEQLKNLAENPETRKRLSKEGREQVVGNFSLNNEIKAYETLYSKLST